MADSSKVPESFSKFDGSRSSWRAYHINLKALFGRFKLLATLALATAAIEKAVKDGDEAILNNVSMLYSVILASISDSAEGLVLKEWLAGKCEHIPQGYNDGVLAYELLCNKFGVASNAGQNAVDANNVIDQLDHIKLEQGGNTDAFINKLGVFFLRR